MLNNLLYELYFYFTNNISTLLLSFVITLVYIMFEKSLYKRWKETSRIDYLFAFITILPSYIFNISDYVFHTNFFAVLVQFIVKHLWR